MTWLAEEVRGLRVGRGENSEVVRLFLPTSDCDSSYPNPLHRTFKTVSPLCWGVCGYVVTFELTIGRVDTLSSACHSELSSGMTIDAQTLVNTSSRVNQPTSGEPVVR